MASLSTFRPSYIARLDLMKEIAVHEAATALHDEAGRTSTLLAGVGLILLVALPALFLNLGAPAIQLWDEARPALHALEMAYPVAGHEAAERWLVPHYRGEPESWHLKPPLMTWLSAVSMRALGPSEFALRLPSASAALATALLLLLFCFYRLQSPLAGIAAGIALLTTTGYVAEHVARTADYDALLTLWTTAFGLAAFAAIEGEGRQRALWVLGAWLSLVAATLTKSIAGLMLVPVVFLYAGTRGQLRLMLRAPMFWAGLVVWVIVVVSYYGIRENLQPGYLAAVLNHEILGRYGEGIDGLGRSAFYYMQQLVAWQGHPWLAFVPAAALAAVSSSGQTQKRAGWFALAVATSYVLIISFSATKHPWYLAPAFPWIAFLFGMGLEAVAKRLSLPRILIGASVLLLPCYVALGDAISHPSRAVAPWLESSEHEYAEAEYLRHILRRTPPLRHGDRLVFVSDGYNGALEFYAALAARSGVQVEIREQAPTEGVPVASCSVNLVHTDSGSRPEISHQRVTPSGEAFCFMVLPRPTP